MIAPQYLFNNATLNKAKDNSSSSFYFIYLFLSFRRRCCGLRVCFCVCACSAACFLLQDSRAALAVISFLHTLPYLNESSVCVLCLYVFVLCVFSSHGWSSVCLCVCVCRCECNLHLWSGVAVGVCVLCVSCHVCSCACVSVCVYVWLKTQPSVGALMSKCTLLSLLLGFM